MSKYLHLYSTITDALVRDGYIIIENALMPELRSSLLLFSQDETKYKKAGISAAALTHIDNTKRSDKTLWLDEDASVQSEFLSFAHGLQEYLNRSLYLGLSYYESHFAIYDDGDFYEKHLDAFVNSKNRIVTTVYYLNDDWHDGDGGELMVYDKNDLFLVKVIPSANTLVVFMSQDFPHEVLPSHKKRHSIAGWFRVDRV